MSQYQSYLIVDSSISFCFVLMFRVIFCYYKMNFVFVVSGTSTSVCLMKKTNYIFPRLHYPVFFNLSEIFPFLFSMSFFFVILYGQWVQRRGFSFVRDGGTCSTVLYGGFHVVVLIVYDEMAGWFSSLFMLCCIFLFCILFMINFIFNLFSLFFSFFSFVIDCGPPGYWRSLVVVVSRVNFSMSFLVCLLSLCLEKMSWIMTIID